MSDVMKVTRLEWQGGFRLLLSFSDGTEGVWDATELMKLDGPMLEPLRDPEYFGRAFRQFGVPVWPNGFALDAQVLHDEVLAAGNLVPSRKSA